MKVETSMKDRKVVRTKKLIVNTMPKQNNMNRTCTNDLSPGTIRDCSPLLDNIHDLNID